MIKDNYLDAYVRVIRATDPLTTALVFSCGMGAVRTTFAMVAASLVRRKQLISRGMPDPYATKVPGISNSPLSSSPGTTTVSTVQLSQISKSKLSCVLLPKQPTATVSQNLDLNKLMHDCVSANRVSDSSSP